MLIADATTIERLNAEALALVDEDNDFNGVDAIQAVASRHDMTCVAENGDCIVYRLTDGTHVNAWLDAPAAGIRPGGQGFDDQVEWADLD
jgi:hypothetical protein